MPGPEDLVVDERPGTKRLLVSSLDRSRKSSEGRIFEVELRTKQPRAMKIDWHGTPYFFRPQGIALLRTGPRVRLFVANHGSDGGEAESVLVFDVEESTLCFVERLTGGGIVNPNDLHVRALPGDKYELFVTNPAHQGLAMLWEAFIGPYSSFVARIESGKPETTKIHGFRYPNGVAFHRGRLYVSSSVDQCVFSCSLDDRKPRTKIEVDAVADNLTVEKGTMLVGASSSIGRFLWHRSAAISGKKPLRKCPTEVWRLTPGSPPKTELLYRDSGKEISGGSAAVCIDSHLYIGQVFKDYVLEVRGVCGSAVR